MVADQIKNHGKGARPRSHLKIKCHTYSYIICTQRNHIARHGSCKHRQYVVLDQPMPSTSKKRSSNYTWRSIVALGVSTLENVQYIFMTYIICSSHTHIYVIGTTPNYLQTLWIFVENLYAYEGSYCPRISNFVIYIIA